MKATILSLHIPSPPGNGGQTVIFLFICESGHVAYQIEVKAV